MADVRISVNLDDRRFREAFDITPETRPQTMLAIHNTFAKRNDPYVPFLNGPLSQTLDIKPSGVTYKQIYARYQYYGINFNHTVEFHPLASAMWDKAMLRDHREEFAGEVKELITRDIREQFRRRT